MAGIKSLSAADNACARDAAAGAKSVLRLRTLGGDGMMCTGRARHCATQYVLVPGVCVCVCVRGAVSCGLV